MNNSQKGNNCSFNKRGKIATNNQNYESTTSGESIFREAQKKLQASVQKHITVESESSSEEELEGDNILNSVLQSYSQLGGKHEDLGRTGKFLSEAFQSGAVTCLICIGSIKRNDAIWNCTECFCSFHLNCALKWAKDSISNLKQSIRDFPEINKNKSIQWSCPNCRHEYFEDEIPQKYFCFCYQTLDPKPHPWLVPHSCGETCNRPLKPSCGHKCLLLCHPGPCPPCPKTIQNTCYCKKKPPQTRRCSDKYWSCGAPCNKLLKCGKHFCINTCHPGECLPCPKTSLQSCICGSQKTVQRCASPQRKCDKVCGKAFSCGNHRCEVVCHSGECGNCPLTESRTCPCGKAVYKLPCIQDVPVCGDTCGRTLECRDHFCPRPCHRDKCGSCLEVVVKTCRCGSHSKEQPCKNEFICKTKCKKIKNCSRHPCNRKCCDGQCPPCEKVCGRTLPCGNHECAATCHQGRCYPCVQTREVRCFCKQTSITVPCGLEKRTKPPKCSRLCRHPPDCHHERRVPHKCHFGKCPPCKQICGHLYKTCNHSCSSHCHETPIPLPSKKPAPWERETNVTVTLVKMECPPCKVPVNVTCLGGHETCEIPCSLAKPFSCGRVCGRTLLCGNHQCEKPCHILGETSNETQAGKNCDVCESGCEKPRPEDCTHPCLKPCHQEECPPCRQMLRVTCHCRLNSLYIDCFKWSSSNKEERKSLQSCGNQCPKNYDCGHRCSEMCHPGECPIIVCRKKVKLHCSCRRLRKDFPCNDVRAGIVKVCCDEICAKKKEERIEAELRTQQQKEIEERKRNEEELERFQKKFQGRKKHKRRFSEEVTNQVSLFQQYWLHLCGFTVMLAVIYFFSLS